MNSCDRWSCQWNEKIWVWFELAQMLIHLPHTIVPNANGQTENLAWIRVLSTTMSSFFIFSCPLKKYLINSDNSLSLPKIGGSWCSSNSNGNMKPTRHDTIHEDRKRCINLWSDAPAVTREAARTARPASARWGTWGFSVNEQQRRRHLTPTRGTDRDREHQTNLTVSILPMIFPLAPNLKKKILFSWLCLHTIHWTEQVHVSQWAVSTNTLYFRIASSCLFHYPFIDGTCNITARPHNLFCHCL